MIIDFSDLLLIKRTLLIRDRSSRFLDLTFLETSALSGENIKETFCMCTKTILAKIDSGMISKIQTFPKCR